MATFAFDQTFTSHVGSTAGGGTNTLTYSEGGVNFTWTVQNGDASHAHSIGGGQLTAVESAGTNAASNDIFVLDVTGVGETRFDGAIQFTVTNLGGSWTVNGQPLVSGANTLSGPQSDLTFTPTGGTDFDFFIINSLTATVNCFTAGTRIATPDGPRDVETLQPGDMVLTASGEAQPVKWLGHFDVDTRLMHPAKVNPICITAGALGNGLPKRDLRLSPDHAIEIDGVLYNAGTLVNGSTIYQVAKMPLPGFTYYHIETEAHELLMAEGVAAESFIDYAGRDGFDNCDEVEARTITEMNLPRVSAQRLVPDQIRARLAPRPVAA
ncbi:Hint domain-containing protein [uncultured Roseovarius sp.]|uniref:Hint domain-containing protein n=1 Tax=uncultured Roseovarius sp. TaxID=293344 RepID=UPI00261335AA|nr:Hint domain-containing protein [uncultured Roseovarius sp.]